MKYLYILLIPIYLIGGVHYAKVEPYEEVTLKAAVNGTVLEANISNEGRNIAHKRIIHIDDRLDKLNLLRSRESKKLLNEILVNDEKIARSLRESMSRSKAYYERIKNLSTVSKTQKDNAYSSYASANTQYLNMKEKILNLRKQLLDIDFKIAQLQDTIAKKSISIEKKFLNTLLVKKGEYVMPGSGLAVVDDLNKARLVLFLEPMELEGIEDKKLYLNGKESKYKLKKIWKLTDKKYISSYRAELIIPYKEEYFSKLVKVEIR